jgi:hypothetical protein
MGGSSEQNILSKVFVLDTEKRPLFPNQSTKTVTNRIWKIKDLLIAQLSPSLFVLAHKITQGTFHN